ncbi:hypothetical protein [Nocardioides sp. CFH 31398]|uniref:hypothetical protein n=1 Tax=Nocardioides sp. CFH 31398 TaxID=2919579 RepID=UPI001F05CBE8|nr:hypothetical protein [Nocardioides sp. CFH 31398]
MRIDPAGEVGPTPGKARGPGWRRSGPGLYVPSWVDAHTPEQRIVEAAARLPERGAITGWAGLRWLGAGWLDGRTPDGREERDVVLLAMNADLRPFPGHAFSAERLSPADVVVVDGVPVTVPVRSVCFELRYPVGDREGIVAADMAAFANLVSRSEIDAYLPYLSGWTGVQRVRDALPLISENSWSPPETRMRLVWLLDAHLPMVLCNQPVFDRRGRHLGTPDLLDPVAGVAGEYDGAAWHLGPTNRRRDVRREDHLRGAGLETFTVVAGQVASREALAARMRRTRARARWEDPSARAWTLTPPRGWHPRLTVADRRAS